MRDGGSERASSPPQDVKYTYEYLRDDAWPVAGFGFPCSMEILNTERTDT